VSADEYDWRLSMTGEGEPLVLVSGMDGTGQLFYRQVPLLAPRFRTTTYALRDDAADMGTLVRDLGRVIDATAPVSRRALVVGESFGGALAMSFALAHPEQVAALIVLNSFPYFAPQFRLRLARYGLGLLPWGMMSFVRRATAFRLHSAHTHRHEIRRFMDVTAAASRTGYLNRLQILMAYDIRERLHALQPPTLFLAADQDHLVPSVQQAIQMASRVPHATLRILRGHGHICLIAPDIDLAALITAWRGPAATTHS
jgi:pimeloyl-ACP methyl ester carboxylesterase